MSLPRSLVAIFGYSGTGKTVLASNIACHHVMRGDKVLFVSDRPVDVTSKMELLLSNQATPDAMQGDARARFSLLAVHDFNHQLATVQHLPFAFWPAGNDSGNRDDDLAGITTTNLNRHRVDPVEAIASPRAIIIDEFTRLYGSRVLKPAGPGSFNKEISFQLGMLKWLSRERDVSIIVTTSTRAIIVDDPDTGDAIMADGPSARAAMEHFADASIQLAWTGTPGERRLQWKQGPDAMPDRAGVATIAMDALFSPFPGA